MIESIIKYNTNVSDLFEHIIKEDDFELNHVIVEPGKIFPKHPTDANIIVIIVKGELSITLGEQEQHTYSRGDVVTAPLGIESELGNQSDSFTELFVIKRR